MIKPIEPHVAFLQHSDSGKTNTDISECSTNTEDYVTCNTDLSKRGTKPPSISSSSTTQMPGSNPNHTLGSMFCTCLNVLTVVCSCDEIFCSVNCTNFILFYRLDLELMLLHQIQKQILIN